MSGELLGPEKETGSTIEYGTLPDQVSQLSGFHPAGRQSGL
jgi:hypothetical protein